MKRVYLDWNSTAPPDPRVFGRMEPYLHGRFGNPSSLHAEGREARRAVEEAREAVAEAIGAEPREIVFCSGATEANNLALRGLSQGREGPLLVSAIEHPSILECADGLRQEGRDVAVLPVTAAGVADTTVLESALGRRPAVTAVMAANNETGVIQPVEVVADLCARKGLGLHVDAVQAPGRAPFDVRHPGITAASLSAHKLGGPKGAGALFVRSGSPLGRQLHGGGQERGRRAGTENVAGIVGLAEALRLAVAELGSRRDALLRLERAFLAALRAGGVAFTIRGAAAEESRLPGTLSLGFHGVSGEGMLLGLDLLGVSVSLGSACSSGAARPSHVLAAMGVPKQENLESVRFSMGPALAVADVEAAAAAVAEVARRAMTRPRA
jgi:cysteine desulfurase